VQLGYCPLEFEGSVKVMAMVDTCPSSFGNQEARITMHVETMGNWKDMVLVAPMKRPQKVKTKIYLCNMELWMTNFLGGLTIVLAFFWLI
jgi:hypothetical protein